MTVQSSQRTAGTPCCGGEAGLWSAWLWHCVDLTAPMPGRNTDGPSGYLPGGSTDWAFLSSPTRDEQSPPP